MLQVNKAGMRAARATRPRCRLECERRLFKKVAGSIGDNLQPGCKRPAIVRRTFVGPPTSILRRRA